jgi:hypothetical protein
VGELLGMAGAVVNGIVLGKPEPGIEISLSWGYLVGLAGAASLTVAGLLRQALPSDAKKPPGVL